MLEIGCWELTRPSTSEPDPDGEIPGPPPEIDLRAEEAGGRRKVAFGLLPPDFPADGPMRNGRPNAGEHGRTRGGAGRDIARRKDREISIDEFADFAVSP